jgi:hypothetical protein
MWIGPSGAALPHRKARTRGHPRRRFSEVRLRNRLMKGGASRRVPGSRDAGAHRLRGLPPAASIAGISNECGTPAVARLSPTGARSQNHCPAAPAALLPNRKTAPRLVGARTVRCPHNRSDELTDGMLRQPVAGHGTCSRHSYLPGGSHDTYCGCSSRRNHRHPGARHDRLSYHDAGPRGPGVCVGRDASIGAARVG